MGRRNAAAFSPPLSSWLHLCFPRGGGGGGLCSHLCRGSKGKISTFQCYSYAAEL